MQCPRLRPAVTVTKENNLELQRCEEPPVLAGLVSLLESLLDGLLGVLPLRDLLECVLGEGTLQVLELDGVAGGHDVGVCGYQRVSLVPFCALLLFRIVWCGSRTVDLLDERLDLALLGLLVLRHAAGDLLGVALDTGDEGVGEGVRLGAVVEGRDDQALLAGIATAADDLIGL